MHALLRSLNSVHIEACFTLEYFQNLVTKCKYFHGACGCRYSMHTIGKLSPQSHRLRRKWCWFFWNCFNASFSLDFRSSNLTDISFRSNCQPAQLFAENAILTSELRRVYLINICSKPVDFPKWSHVRLVALWMSQIATIRAASQSAWLHLKVQLFN